MKQNDNTKLIMLKKNFPKHLFVLKFYTQNCCYTKIILKLLWAEDGLYPIRW